MERQYIWFHTAEAFVVAAIGIIVATIAALIVMFHVPENFGVQLGLVFAVYAIGILPAFLVERWQRARSCGPQIKRWRISQHERLTDRARIVLRLADEEAGGLKHEYVGTEHLLLGLVKEGTGVASNVLSNLNVDPRQIRIEIEKIVQPGPDVVTIRNRPHTPRAKKVIEYALEEARDLNHNYVGTEHILLGLLREEEGVAAKVLINLGLKLEAVREEVFNLLRSD